MSSTVLVAVLTFLGTSVTALGVILGVRARSSGNVKNTDADKLWDSAKNMLDESTKMRDEVRKESAERGKRITELERLRKEDRREAEKQLAAIRQEAAATHRECQEELARLSRLVTTHDQSLGVVKREVAIVKKAVGPTKRTAAKKQTKGKPR